MKSLSVVAAVVVAISILPGSSRVVQAQDFPNRPITWVVPFPPGGSGDLGARAVGKALSEKLGQPIVIDNKPGAGGVIGAEMVANAKPDGYTMLYAAAAPMAGNPSLIKNLSYDPIKSFTALHGIAMSPLVIATNQSKPYKTFQELIAYAKANPGKLNYSSPGIGTAHHLAGELTTLVAKVEMTHVPYKGSAPAVTDSLSGTIDVMIDNFAPIRTHLEAGKLRPLAITGTQRLALLPDVPTVAELGYPDIVISSWATAALPANTPAPIVNKLSAAFDEALRDPAVVKYFEEAGSIIMTGIAKEKLTEFYKAEVAKFKMLIEKSGATAN